MISEKFQYASETSMLLFQSVDKFLPATTPGRIFPKLSQMVDRIDTQRKLVIQRHTGAIGLMSRGVLLLQQILAVADIESLQNISGDFARAAAILNIERILTGLFDIVDTGVSHRSTFVDSNSCIEILIPIRYDDCFRVLPFDSKYEDWAEIRPLRVLDHNSRELTFKLINNKISFQKQVPDYCVFGIDVMALVLQYMHYIQAFGVDSDVTDYIHDYVISPLHEDLETIWLRHVYYDTLSGGSEPKTGTSGDIYHGISTDVPAALDSLKAQIPAVRSGQIAPDAMLSALPVVDQRYLSHYLLSLEDQCVIVEQRQYWPYHYLMMMPWLKLIVLTYRLNRDYTQTKNLQTYLRRDLSIFRGYQFTTGIHNHTVKQLIERDATVTFDWLLNG